MLKFKKFLFCFALVLVLISSCVFATDNNASTLASTDDSTVPETIKEETTTNTPVTINEDLYIYNTDSYTFGDIIYGNIFSSTNKFVVTPQINGGIVSGNLFLISSETIIESNVTYSNNKDKNGTYLIDAINSKSIINGNIYTISDTFTLEAGSEIHGDLYIVGTKVNIEPNTVIYGNIYVSASEVNLNGQIKGSAYVTSDNFNMGFYSYIERDLYLNSQNATLDGVVYRNAFVTVNENLVTKSDFKVNQDFSADFVNNFTFSGKITGNATINAKNLTFKNDNSEACIIRGNLNYGTQNDVQIPDEVVGGEITISEYVNQVNNKIDFSSLILGLLTMIIYVLVVVILAKRLAPKALEKIQVLNLKTALLGLLAGFVSVFVIFIIFILLCLLSVGVTLALFFISGYLFLLALALPTFLNQVSELIKIKLNPYIKLLLVIVVYHLLGFIPYVGGVVSFAAILIGMGQILLGLFNKNK